MKIPGANKELEVFFRSVLPDEVSIQVKPMFGNLAAFVNGNLFSGLYGDTLFVRLSDMDRVELLKTKGTKLFEPMKGRPMKEYVCLPEDWLTQRSKVTPWISRALASSGKLPPKEKKKKSTKK
jgi:TfoX/Sxy family transcriptional regulator of competence genes